MKRNRISRYSVLIALFALWTTAGLAQSKKEEKQERQAMQEKALETLVRSQHYHFVPLSVTPMSGRMRELPPDYFLSVTKDTVETYLPYFGKVYQPTLGRQGDNWNFRSTRFDYQITERKKGGWVITLKPRDVGRGDVLTLEVMTSGYATLEVISVDRESISYYGTLSEIK